LTDHLKNFKKFIIEELKAVVAGYPSSQDAIQEQIQREVFLKRRAQLSEHFAHERIDVTTVSVD